MNFQLINKNDPEKLFISVRNAHSASMARGVAAVFAMNGTQDGVAVKPPSQMAAATATSFFAGILPLALAANEYGLSQVYGFADYVKISRAQTRASSTDAYAAGQAVALGDQLAVETVNDGVTRSGAGSQVAWMPVIAAADTLAAQASSASTSSDTSVSTTVSTGIRAFIHAM